MDIGLVLTELRHERDQINEAILSLERMETGTQKRRGRPPAWMIAAREMNPTKRRGRPLGSKKALKK
jgi:hypothetical protein